MVKFGDKRLEMEGNILRGVEEMVENIKLKEGRAVDIGHMLMHSVGNVVFNLVFGKTWEEDDETWKKLINLQEEGTKLIGVAGPINFLPFLRFVRHSWFTFYIISPDALIFIMFIRLIYVFFIHRF